MEQPLVIHQARWVITMEGPVITDGAVLVAGDRLVGVGPAAAIRQSCQTKGFQADEMVDYDHGEGAIIPALVNSHIAKVRIILRYAFAAAESQDLLDGQPVLCLHISNPDLQIVKISHVRGCPELMEDACRLDILREKL